MKSYNEISVKLRHLIVCSGMSKMEIYTKLGLSQPTFNKKLINPEKFYVKEFNDLLSLLNTNPTDFYGGIYPTYETDNREINIIQSMYATQ